MDTRQLLLQLLKFEHDFVNYWTLEVLMVLCRCPLSPRNLQQEFINKHTLLTDKMLLCLIGLMSYRTDDSGGEIGGEPHEEDVGYAGPHIHIDDEGEDEGMEEGSPMQTPSHKKAHWDTPPGLKRKTSASTASTSASASATADGNSASASASAPPASSHEVAANPSTFAHLPQGSAATAQVASALLASDADAVPSGSSLDLVNFTPNSLVVIGAAALLESLVCSRRDSSSPELLHQVLEIMGDRCEVLVSMLRSTSFLIMENAAILMFTLVKNRPTVAPLLKELALSECLVLKHFYNAVFSPSSTQRFISRFLVATWVTGSASNPGNQSTSYDV